MYFLHHRRSLVSEKWKIDVPYLVGSQTTQSYWSKMTISCRASKFCGSQQQPRTTKRGPLVEGAWEKLAGTLENWKQKLCPHRRIVGKWYSSFQLTQTVGWWRLFNIETHPSRKYHRLLPFATDFKDGPIDFRSQCHRIYTGTLFKIKITFNCTLRRNTRDTTISNSLQLGQQSVRWNRQC